MIQLSELISPEGIFLDLEASSPDEALENIVHRLVEAGMIEAADGPTLVRRLCEREKLCSTAVGHGAAIPHAYLEKIPRPLVVIGRLTHPVAYCGPESEPVDLIFMLLGPERIPGMHLQVLSKIVRLIKDDQFDMELRGARTAQAVSAAVFEVEQRHH